MVLTSSPEKEKLLMIMNEKKRKMGDKPTRKAYHSKITKTNTLGKSQVRISTDDAENDNNSSDISDSSSSDDGTVSDLTDESEYSEPETKLHDDFESGIDDIKIEDFILVKYQIGTKSAKHYVGQVSEIRGSKYDVAYLRRYHGSESLYFLMLLMPI